MEETIHDGRERLVTGYSGRIALALALGSTATSIGRQLLPPLLPAIIEDLSITPTAAGVALSVMWVMFAFSQYPAGRFADRWTRKTIVGGGIAIMVVGFAGITLVLSYPLLIAAVAAIGFGAGLYIVSMRVLLSDLFVERRGQAFGFNTSANMLGGATAAGLAVVVLGLGSWTLGFIPVVVILTMVFLLLHVWNNEPYVVTRADLGVRGTLARVFGTRYVQVLVVSYSLYMVAWQGVFSFLPTALQVAKGFSPTVAAAGFAIPFVVGIVTMPLAGGLSDRTARPPIAIVGLLLSALGLVLIILMETILPVFLGIVCFAVGLMAFPPVMQAYLMDRFRGTSVGGDFGAFRTVYFTVGSVGPTYVGFVAERFDYLLAFWGLVACLVLGSLSILLVYRPGALGLE